tara:strand:+ start:1423 stop:2130 length:708 start_codon:yes stop_codon:yes gene_type:complete
MAGKSSRFFSEGYSIPKFLIKINGLTLLEHSVFSLPLDLADGLIFIILKEHEEKYSISEFISKTIPYTNVQFVFIDHVTRGQAETVFKAIDYVDANEDIVIYNIDTKFKSRSLVEKLKSLDNEIDGVIGAFHSPGSDSHWSFAEVAESGVVLKTAEKQKISDHALTGLYHFSKSKLFFETCEKWINKQSLINGEFYIAPMYNDLISSGKRIIIDIVDDFFPLGTPDEVNNFKNGY